MTDEVFGFDLPAESQANPPLDELTLIFSTSSDEDFLGFSEPSNASGNPNLALLFLDESSENEFFGF